MVKRLFFSFAKAKVLMNKITFPTFIFTIVKTKQDLIDNSILVLRKGKKKYYLGYLKD